MDRTGGQQQLRDLGCLPGPVEEGARWTAECDLGQRAGASWGGGAGVSADARAGAAAGEPPFTRGQALPGYSPDFNADEAIWGWAREEATGNLSLGTKALVQERVGNFLAGLASRRNEVRRRCRNKGRSTPTKFPARFPASGECTSHLEGTLRETGRGVCRFGLTASRLLPPSLDHWIKFAALGREDWKEPAWIWDAGLSSPGTEGWRPPDTLSVA